jgi:glucokinase
LLTEGSELGSLLFIGVDIGRTIRAALVDEAGRIWLQSRVLAERRDPRAFLGQVIAVLRALRDSEAARGRVAAIGIGWPGLIDRQTPRIALASHLVDLTACDVYGEIREALDVPLVFENEANAAAYGEWACGAAHGFRDVFYVTIGTGIGAALILDGRVHRGAHGFAGEFGHVKVEPRGIECGCGGRGCLETIASGPNIVRRVRERLFSDPAFSLSPLAAQMEGTLTVPHIVQAALEGDELARAVLRETGRYFGLAIANVLNLLDVEMVCLGGPVMLAGEILLDAVRKEARKHTLRVIFERCRFTIGALGQDAGIIGAALLAREAVAAMTG